MKFFTDERIAHKIIIALVIVILFNFMSPRITFAAEGNDSTLLNPILTFITLICDGIMELLNKVVMDCEFTFFDINMLTTWQRIGKTVLKISLIIVAVAGTIAGMYFSGGSATPAITAAWGKILGGLAIAGFAVTGYATAAGAVIGLSHMHWRSDIRIPNFMVTPQEIFLGLVPMLDVNFINPRKYTQIEKQEGATKIDLSTTNDNNLLTVEDVEVVKPATEKDVEDKLKSLGYYNENIEYKERTETQLVWINPADNKAHELTIERSNNGAVIGYTLKSGEIVIKYPEQLIKKYGGEIEKAIKATNKYSEGAMNYEKTTYRWDDYKLTVEVSTPNSSVSGSQYLKGSTRIVLTQYEYVEKEQETIASEIQGTISSWYIALRNLALVILLSVLIYIGIRIVISSAAGEKAKYKQRLLDWVIAMCLLFSLHYIMAMANFLVDSVNGLFITQAKCTTITLPPIEDSNYNLGNLEDLGEEAMETDFYKNINGVLRNGEPLTTNLMGKVRIMMQLKDDEEVSGNLDIGQSLMYFVLVIYTIMFLFIYIRRVIYMAFLTLIAPLVAMTYPLDKLSDGKAQAFNMWFKEYMFTLLIQPVHALLYMVFVNMAMDFASKNTIYAIVTIGFILQAERIIRKFFGFDKAGAFPIMNSALGGAMVMQGMSWLRGRGRKGPKGEGPGGEKGVRVKSSDRGSSNDMDAEGVLLGGTPPVSGGTGGAVASAPRTVETNSFEDAYGGGSSYTPFSAPTSAAITPHNTPSSPKTKPSFGKKLRSYGKTIGKNAVLKGSNAIARGAAKAVTKLPLAATLGTIGIAAGLASDNDANILKYGAAGAGIGWSLGRTPDGKGWAAIQDEAMLDAYGSDYKEYLNEKADQTFMNDPDALRTFGGDRTKMEKALEYRAYGITDNKIIKRAMKLSGYSDEEKIALAKIASEISSHKDLETFGKGIRQRGATEEQTEELLKALKELKGYSF